MNKLKNLFLENTPFKVFLLSVLITSVSYGLYKGMLDNFMAEIVGMGEADRGVSEFFRELPGVLLVFILAAFYMFSVETMYKAGAVIMLIGMAMHAVLPPTKVLATLAICMYSFGEHIQLGMKSTLSLKYASPGKGGVALGTQTSVNQIGTLLGYLVVAHDKGERIKLFTAYKRGEYTTSLLRKALDVTGIPVYSLNDEIRCITIYPSGDLKIEFKDHISWT